MPHDPVDGRLLASYAKGHEALTRPMRDGEWPHEPSCSRIGRDHNPSPISPLAVTAAARRAGAVPHRLPGERFPLRGVVGDGLAVLVVTNQDAEVTLGCAQCVAWHCEYDDCGQNGTRDPVALEERGRWCAQS